MFSFSKSFIPLFRVHISVTSLVIFAGTCFTSFVFFTHYQQSIDRNSCFIRSPKLAEHCLFWVTSRVDSNLVPTDMYNVQCTMYRLHMKHATRPSHVKWLEPIMTCTSKSYRSYISRDTGSASAIQVKSFTASIGYHKPKQILWQFF